MRHLIVFMETGYCGEEGCDILEVPEDTPEGHIDDIVMEMALEHGISFGREGYDEEWGVEGHWEDYVPERHDRYRCGGGSFQEEFSS